MSITRETKRQTTEILIIGTGPAGITLACELSGSKKDITLVEMGGDNFSNASQSEFITEQNNTLFPNTQRSRLSQLGGTSNHWANNTSPFSEIDFEEREWLTVPGWPIKYSEINKHYKAAEFYCGTDGTGFTNSSLLGDELLRETYRDNPLLQIGVAKAAIPPTRFQIKHKDKLNSDNVKILTKTKMVSLEYNENEKRIVGATFLNEGVHIFIEAKHVVLAMGGIENARHLLIANSKYNNNIGNKGGMVGACLMEHPTLIGANLFTVNEHLLSPLGMQFSGDFQSYKRGFFEIKESALREYNISNVRLPIEKSTALEMSDGVASFHSLLDVMRGRESLAKAPSHVMRTLVDWDLVLQATLNKLNRPQLVSRAEQLSGYQINLMMEQGPEKENCITLSQKKDSSGLPLAKIAWRVSQKDKDRLWQAVQVFSNGISFGNIGRVRTLKHYESRAFGDQLGFAHHHLGTTRMSKDEKNGVVDSDLKVFNTENLYIAGSSVFSTGSHIPPTLTIVALSIRLAEHLKNRV